MTSGKTPALKKYLSLSLYATLLAGCGSETPAFQERAMSVLTTEQSNVLSPTAGQGQSSDATVATNASIDQDVAEEIVPDDTLVSNHDNFMAAEVGGGTDSGDTASAGNSTLDSTAGGDQSGIASKTSADNNTNSTAPVVDKAQSSSGSAGSGSAGSPAPVIETQPLALKVDVKDSQLRFGSQTTQLNTTWGDNPMSDVTYQATAAAGKDPGKIVGNTYTSPATGTEAYEVKIVAISNQDGEQSPAAIIKLEPSTQVFAGCTADNKGFPIRTEVFSLPVDTQHLPDFGVMGQKSSTVCMDAFQIANRSWSDGFPGHPELIEWFAIRATTQLTISKSGKHYFRLNADDGAKLYIDGQLIVDNDGQHAEKAVTGNITLSAGDHELVMEYFQGPRYHIALELYWKTPGTGSYVYVPASAFKP